MKNILSRSEYEQYGSSCVRKRFIEAFINDTLLEKREHLEIRVNKLINMLQKDISDEVLIISHSFFMKILEVLFVHKLNIFKIPSLFALNFDYQVRTYDFVGGFEFTLPTD